jgi:hypothetical protein
MGCQAQFYFARGKLGPRLFYLGIGPGSRRVTGLPKEALGASIHPRTEQALRLLFPSQFVFWSIDFALSPVAVRIILYYPRPVGLYFELIG